MGKGAASHTDNGNGTAAASSNMHAGKEDRVTDRGVIIDNSRLGVSQTDANAGAGGAYPEGTDEDLASVFRLSLGAMEGLALANSRTGDAFIQPTWRSTPKSC